MPTPPLPIPSNPFASRYVRPGALAFRTVSATSPPIDSIVTRLREVRCGVIVGAHGTGKSTLLRTLAETLDRTMPGGQWVQLTRDTMSSTAGRLSRYRNQTRETIANMRTVLRVQRIVRPGGVLVIDGAEQLPSVCRWLIAGNSRRAAHHCLLTSHHDMIGFETLFRTSLCPELIVALLDELLSHGEDSTNAALRVHLQNHIPSIDLDSVTNLRELWDELYEVMERFPQFDE